MFVAGSVQKTIGFALLQISVNPVEVVAVLRRIFISRGVSFMQHFVFPKLAVRRDPLVYRLSFSRSHVSPNPFYLTANPIRTFAI